MASKWTAPDGNVWIALASEPHTHHRVARRWFRNRQDKRPGSAALPGWAFAKLFTNKHVMEEEVMSPDATWQAYRILRLDRRIGSAAEPSELLV